MIIIQTSVQGVINAVISTFYAEVASESHNKNKLTVSQCGKSTSKFHYCYVFKHKMTKFNNS